MSIARIQIDFGLLPNEKLEDMLLLLGDLVMPVLDPHDDDDECLRWVSIEATYADEDYVTVSFLPEEEQILMEIGVPDIFRENSGNN